MKKVTTNSLWGYVLCTFFDAYGNPRLFACRE